MKPITEHELMIKFDEYLSETYDLAVVEGYEFTPSEILESNPILYQSCFDARRRAHSPTDGGSCCR